jgi:hypothetical protein
MRPTPRRIKGADSTQPKGEYRMKLRIIASTPLLVAAAVALLACSQDLTMPNDGAPQFAKGGGGGNGGGKDASPSVISASGDIGPLATAGGDDVTASLGKNPFKNLTLSDVRITIGQDPALSGDGQRCREKMPDRTVVPTVDDTDWPEEVRGDWVGELTIWQGKNTSESNFRFAGTRPGDPDIAVQFTSNSDNAVQSSAGSTTTLEFVDAPLGFGAGPGRVVPRDDNGLPIIYCVNVTITAQK